MEMFAKSMRRFNLHTPVTNVQVQIYDIEEGENMQQEHKKVYVIILQALRPPLKFQLFYGRNMGGRSERSSVFQ
jgi:hypothetical protein